MTQQIRFSPQGHVFESEDGKTPDLIDADRHTYVECVLCYRSVCIHDGPAKPLLEASCRKYEPELPGLELPVVPVPKGRYWDGEGK